MQILMVNKVWLLVPGLLIASASMADGYEAFNSEKGICKGKVESLQECRWIEGTVSIYNGTPSIRIRQHKSKKVYAVGPAEQEWMPDELKSKLTIDNEIQAHLKICPISKEKQKGLPVVCIDESKIHRVIENP